MIDLLKTYIENKIQLLKLELISVSANLAAKLVSMMVAALLFMLLLLLFSIAASFGIGQYLDNIALGFTIVGGIYLLFFIFYYLVFKERVGGIVKDFVVKVAIGAQDDLTND